MRISDWSSDVCSSDLTAEAPGKRRLDRDAYFAVQRIYYPGFTIGGICEPAAIVALAALLLMTGTDTPAFTGILVTLVAAITGQAVYWLVTHPVNKRWIAERPLGEAGGKFFGTGGEARDRKGTRPTSSH